MLKNSSQKKQDEERMQEKTFLMCEAYITIKKLSWKKKKHDKRQQGQKSSKCQILHKFEVMQAHSHSWQTHNLTLLIQFGKPSGAFRS